MSRTRNRPGRSPPVNPGILGTGVTRSRGFNCHACGAWFGVFQNAAGLNAGHNAIGGDQTFALECPSCTHSDDYSTQEIVAMTPDDASGPEA